MNEQIGRPTALQRLKRDKILLGLIICGALALFVGVGWPTAEEQKAGQQHQTAQQPQGAAPVHPNAVEAPKDALNPTDATDFVKWWIGLAMDYNLATCQKNHADAFGWMTPQAKSAFQSCFWTQEIINGLSSGQYAAAFQPATIQAKAKNPDGSMVVGYTGTLVVQTSGGPCSQQIVTDVLLKRDKDGIRIIGVYNWTLPTAQQPVQQQMQAPMIAPAPSVSAAPIGRQYSPTVY